MTEGSKNKFVERRGGQDRLLRIMSGLGIIGWASLLVAMIVVDRAKPDDPTFIPNERIFEMTGTPYHLRTTWDQELLTAIFYLLSIGLVLGIIGLAVNSRRHRRRGDYYRIHLVLLTAISAVGILYYLIF
ncbi:MAG: hypothetical protein KDI73_07515 [Candidatus Competibacteraceae bacterium]|nr:hypothetical protein [Candidatus Competibacteraceae bacterium]